MRRLPEPDEVVVARRIMERHYNEPVRPVSHYCERLAEYAEGLDVAIQSTTERGGRECGPFGELEAAVTVRDGLRLLKQWAGKSNLLARLVYQDEPLRTERCPEHKGRWSGCTFGSSKCPHCMDGLNVTGWIAHDLRVPRCEIAIRGERCEKPEGHEGWHRGADSSWAPEYKG